MEALSICDCTKGKPVRYFCIAEGCIKRRLCADCNRAHHIETDHDIRQLGKKNSLSTLSLNKENPDRDLIAHQLINTLNVLSNMKEKMIVDATQVIQKCFDEAFKEYFEQPIELIAGTKDLAQEIQRKKLIHYQTIENYQLDKIAKEVRDLNYEQFKSLASVRELCQQMINDFTSLREKMAGNLKLTVMENMKYITPVNKTIKKIQKKQKDEKDRINFLKKFEKNLIGWESLISFEQWMKSNKLQDIQDLSLGNSNLEVIPVQLSLFPNLKRLDLVNNKIKKIQNLDSLKDLYNLKLSFNKIQKIEGLESLTKLNRLNLWKNKVNKIENLEHLTNLAWINLDGNPLEKTEETIWTLKKLKANKISVGLPNQWKI